VRVGQVGPGGGVHALAVSEAEEGGGDGEADPGGDDDAGEDAEVAASGGFGEVGEDGSG
jgi:hypothetical protein